MNLFHNWIFMIILYLIFAVTYNQCFKQLTKKMEHDGAMIVLIDGLGGLFCLLLIPLFKFRLPEDPRVYLFLGLACVFYALNDRFSTTARKGIQASVYSMLKQLSTVFMIFASFLFFKEEFVITKFIGALLIVFSNFIIFYEKNFKFDKYTLYGLLGSICNTVAVFINVSYSKQFNFPFYVAFTLLVPAILIFIFERIKVKDMVSECKKADKLPFFLTFMCAGLMLTVKLYAYELGEVMIVAPLCSLTIILNVFAGFIFFKERKKLPQKIIAALLIILALILIKL